MMASNSAAETSANVQLEDSWKRVLADEFELDYMRQLRQFLVAEKPLARKSTRRATRFSML